MNKIWCHMRLLTPPKSVMSKWLEDNCKDKASAKILYQLNRWLYNMKAKWMSRIHHIPIHFVKSCQHPSNITINNQDDTFHCKMPRWIVLVLIIYNKKPCLKIVISIPNYKHLGRENPQVMITVEFLFKLCICLNPTITPGCFNVRVNIQSLALIVLKYNIENPIPFIYPHATT